MLDRRAQRSPPAAAGRPRRHGRSCSTGLSTPTFLLGILLIYFFFYRLHLVGHHLFPAGGYVPFTQSPYELVPAPGPAVVTLALVSAAVYSRLTRSSLLDTMAEDYIRTARAKGLTERTCCTGTGCAAR